MPPLIVDEATMIEALDITESALKRIARGADA